MAQSAIGKNPFTSRVTGRNLPQRLQIRTSGSPNSNLHSSPKKRSNMRPSSHQNLRRSPFPEHRPRKSLSKMRNRKKPARGKRPSIAYEEWERVGNKLVTLVYCATRKSRGTLPKEKPKGYFICLLERMVVKPSLIATQIYVKKLVPTYSLSKCARKRSNVSATLRSTATSF